MSQGTDKTYQMLWDCQYCSQKKNLGLTHRHCPNCGATQDTTTRYFPPDSEKVAVEDHPYVGADVLCPSCGNASSRAARCCGNCGGSLTGGRDVALVQAPQAPPPPQWQSASPPTSTWKWKVQYTFVILGAVLALFAGTCAFVFHKRSGAFEVKETHWERNITVEQLDMKRDSAWCDAVPSDGRILDRHDEERSTKQIPDGQTCTTTKKDQGNGTYKEVQECKPKYKSQSVYDKKCDFEAPRWVTLRTEKAQGGDGARQWPTLSLGRTGTSIGSEREASRTEKDIVTFVEPSTGKTSTCDFPESKWRTFKPGARYQGKIGAVTGSIDCDTLVAK